jgi:dynein heavy chain
MWRSLREWEESTEAWILENFATIDAKAISAKADQFSKYASRVEKNLPPNPIAQKLRNMVDTFKQAMPVVLALRNDNLKDSHWAEIKELIGQEFNVKEEGFTLQSLLSLGAQKYQEEI